MMKEIVKWRPVIIGVIIVAVLYATADIISGVSLTLPSFLLVGIIVGYIINSSEKEGAINGAIMGLIGGIIVNGILVVMMMAQGYGDYLVSIISTTVIYIILEIIIAAVGGVLGTLVRAESIKYQETAEEETAEE